MLYAKFQDHRTSGSGVEEKRSLPCMGMKAILVMLPGPFIQLSFPPPKEAPHKI